MPTDLSPAEKILAEELAPKVAAGVKHFDTKHPGWGDLIQVYDLDMNHGRYCMLGQIDGIHGSFNQYIEKWDLTEGWAVEHGFLVDAGGQSTSARYEVLTKLWAAEAEAQQQSTD